MGSRPSPPATSLTANDGYDPLLLAVRARRNYLEAVPIALTLALVAELNGANRRTLGQALEALLALRMAYVKVGLRRRDFKGSVRILGYFGAQAWHGSMAIWCLLVTRDFWGL